MKSLIELYRMHQGKVSDKWSIYLTEYDRLFSGLRDQPLRLLEIGIQNGGSLEIWGRYFPKAHRLIGCDINTDCANLVFDDTRIQLVIGDANTDVVEKEVLSHSTRFDLIIDDGSHTSSDIAKSFARYFRHLNEGGLFVAEDLHCSYWRDFEGGLYYPFSSIAFFKRLADIINHEHWGIAKERRQLLQGFAEKFSVDFDESVLADIHSIEFFNSVCVVRKQQALSNMLNLRFIAGQQEFVVAGILDLSGIAQTPSQVDNAWATMVSAPEEAWQQLTKEMLERDDQISNLNQALIERDSQITNLNQGVADRDAQITNLNQGVADRDAQITNLNQGVADRVEQITNLNQGVADRVEQITNLNQGVADRDEQITNLNQGVTDRDAQLATLSQAVHDKEVHIGNLNTIIAQRDALINAVYGSSSWRISMPLRFIAHQAKRAKRVAELAPKAFTRGGGFTNTLKKAIRLYRREGMAGLKRGFKSVALASQISPSFGSDVFDRNDYVEWVRRYDTLTDKARSVMRNRIKRFKNKPTISVVMPTYNTPIQWLTEAIESVRNQIYPHWELCIADDASTDQDVRTLLEHYAKEDVRIKVVFREQNGHISAASNSALALASGQWVALLDHDDLLTEHALFWVADAINQDLDLRMIYSDEDKIDEVGRRFDPYFKCDWNTDLFYSHNMFSHLGVYRADILHEIGGFRLGLEGSQDYDLALRCIERIEANQIHHVPRVLYHWRMHAESTAQSADAKPYAMLAGELALNEHFQREKIDAKAELIGFGYRVRYALPKIVPLVSLIIPTRNRLDLLRNCVESIFRKTTYQNYEILIVDNGSDDPATLEYLNELQAEAQVKVVRDDSPFNYSTLNNVAAKLARGEVLGLLNNDLEVISPEWLSEMVSIALGADIGAVGTRLWYPDGTLQHGGVILGLGAARVAGHAHHQNPKGAHGYFGRASLINSFSAVTAACLIIRKSIYEEVGGLNETDLQVGFSDIDFCLRLREAGYRNVWTPNAEFYHYESATRGHEDTPEKIARFNKEVQYMKQRWGDLLLHDPAYSPNLTLDYADFSLAWPPRVEILVL